MSFINVEEKPPRGVWIFGCDGVFIAQSDFKINWKDYDKQDILAFTVRKDKVFARDHGVYKLDEMVSQQICFNLPVRE